MKLKELQDRLHWAGQGLKAGEDEVKKMKPGEAISAHGYDMLARASQAIQAVLNGRLDEETKAHAAESTKPPADVRHRGPASDTHKKTEEGKILS